MHQGSCQTLFKQAVIGDHPGILARIHHPQINLAVWKDALKTPATASYANQLDLDAICPDQEWRDDYYKNVTGMQHRRSWTQKTRAGAQAELDSRLERAGFPVAGQMPGETRKNLAAGIGRIAEFFARAVNEDHVTFSLLLFRETEAAFWHTDGGPERGIVTLSGDDGTLWLPDCILPKNHDRRAVYWDEAQKQTLPVQEIGPGDMAIFKCGAQDRPLVHSSPARTRPRLVMTMGAPNRE